jgi:hypothetical protein
MQSVSHIVSIDIEGAAKRVHGTVPVQGLVDDLDHAHAAVGIISVHNLSDPSQPLNSAAVVVVVVEVGVGVVLAGEGLVGHLGTWATMKAAACQYLVSELRHIHIP